jgi:Leucine-rich repeat (LRR) protein
MKMNFMKIFYGFMVVLFGLVLGIAIQSYFHNRDKMDQEIAEAVEAERVPVDLNEDPYVLDISGQGLTELPDFVYDRPGITHLILNNNELTSLPDELAQLTKIRVLELNNNRLDGTLSSVITAMDLEDLQVRNNNLTGLPAQISQLTGLLYVDASGNQITELPASIRTMSDLKLLDLTGSPIEQSVIDSIREDLPFTIISI